MSIDLRLIRYAAALAEHGSFTRAANALGIAQPTLSRGIKDLEADIGLPLFTRHRHGAEATDFGYLFLQQAESVSANPAVRLRVQIDSLEVLGRALRQRALDLVVGESTILDSDESIDVFEPLEPIKGYLFVRAGHPLAASTVSLRDVLDYPLVQVSRLPPRVLKPFLDALGASSTAGHSLPVPAIDCPTIPLAVDTVIGSDAVMLVSLGMVKRELALRRVVPVFHESWMRSNWAFMKLRHRSPGPAATAFLATLRAAHTASLAEDAVLEKRWRARLPRRAVPGNAASPKRREKRSR